MYILLQLVGEWLLEVAVGEIGCKLSNFLKKTFKEMWCRPEIHLKCKLHLCTFQSWSVSCKPQATPESATNQSSLFNTM